MVFERSQSSCVLFVVRHGQTDWNAEKRLQGQIDISLNATGEKQIIQDTFPEIQTLLGNNENSDGLGIDVIVTSPLKRAKESAQILQNLLEVKELVDYAPLKEWNAGDIQGHLAAEIPYKFPEIWNAWKVDRDAAFVFPGGESLTNRFSRVTMGFEELAKSHLGGVLLVSAHGCVIDDLFRKAQNIPLNEAAGVPMKNGGVHVFRLEKEGSVMSWKVLYWQGAMIRSQACIDKLRGLEVSASDNPDNAVTWG